LEHIKLGQVNIYQPDGAGNVSGRMITLIKDRDKLATIKTIIPCFLYEVEIAPPNELAIVYLKRSWLEEEFRMVKFGMT
jgi:hypothetical protein